MSRQKPFLLFVWLLCIVAGLLAFSIATGVKYGLVLPHATQPLVFGIFLLVFPTWLIVVLLITEFVKATRPKNESWWRKAQGLSWGELKQLVQWCPTPILSISAVFFITGLFYLYPFERIHWTGGNPFGIKEAVGFSAGSMLFHSLSLPVLASSARMPGKFSDHYESNKNAS